MKTDKIRLITDSASDIPDEELRDWGVDMIPIPIAVDGREYYERTSFTIPEFYKLLAQSSEIPATSRIPAEEYVRRFREALGQGCSDVIVVTINALGSGIHDSALMAREAFYREDPGAQERMRVHVVDSRTYSMAYGYPVVEAAKMARQGKSAGEILDYLDEFFGTLEIYLAVYSLEYAKKSGRITAAAGFIGDALGLRPIIAMIDGTTRTVEKVRGEKQVVPRLMQVFEKNCTDFSAPVFVLQGENETYTPELLRRMRERLGRDVPVYNIGAAVVANSGPNILAVVHKGRRSPRPKPASDRMNGPETTHNKE